MLKEPCQKHHEVAFVRWALEPKALNIVSGCWRDVSTFTMKLFYNEFYGMNLTQETISISVNDGDEKRTYCSGIIL